MSGIRFVSKPREQHNEMDEHQPPTQSKTRLSQRRPPPRWAARRRRYAWLMLALALLGVIAVIVLASNTAQLTGQTHTAQSGTSPTTPSRTQPTNTSITSAIGSFHEYPLPQSDTEMMRPAIDHEGRIWFGEMGHNALAVFDPRTHTFQQITPPQGRFGLMGVEAAPDDTIWFAEQYANYIGHYFPKTKRFQAYPLPRLTVPDPANRGHLTSLPSAPNDLALDTHGNVWFTEFNADDLGRLDTHTDLIQHYPLSAQKSVQTLYPYGITIDVQGKVWFTEATNNRIGRLDPATGDTQFFTAPESDAQLMEIASGVDGTMWATAFTPGLLLRLDPRTGSFTSYNAPFTGSARSGLYGLLVTPTGDVWMTIPAENALARLDVAANRLIYYHIPTKDSLPLGLVMGADHTIWFTEANNIGVLRP